MSLKIKIDGGYADQHKISLDDIATLSKSIQHISRNYELKNEKKQTTDLYIKANKEGSFEMLLDLLNNPIAQSIAAAYLYDLSKEIKNYVLYDEKRTAIQKLIDEIFSLALELAEADYYDIEIEKKKQELEKKEKLLSAEYSSFNAIIDISKLVRETEDDKSNKPKSISFSAMEIEDKEPIYFSIGSKERRMIHEASCESLELEDIVVKGVLTNISREPKASFKMKAPFFGTLKVHTDDQGIDLISDYFKNKQQIKIKIRPIVKIGDLVKTKEAKLLEVIKG